MAVLLLLLSGCTEGAYDKDKPVSIEFIKENASSLEGRLVLTSGIFEIYPNLSLFQDLDARNGAGQIRLKKAIMLNVDFEYDEISSLDCYGKVVIAEGTVVKGKKMDAYYLGGTVRITNSKGEICHVFQGQ
ncbi:hypothetical protein ACFQHU_04245 [Pseudobowmanella zhangzhouensis]|uniref:hypothetical protein n=1 Tax=Pseudobowmanella zhangzhouensis TaxID=1537679 RepID=UPI00103A9158